ncbi:MAG: demethylmenaquinone methyltransferase [Verrucomicrobiales bacterium]|nr:demethylmenaquinone methyltransferase [Verrucomicrobiales bacterium]|tara:strand:- start:339 stop:977 length:639 start_codon:yes stop_codon:yes gene_type:complete
MKAEIIDYIRRNRVSATEVADCLNKTGELTAADALNRGHFRVGNVHWMYACDRSNWTVHEQAQEVQPGDVVVVDAFGCGRRAIFGDLVSKYLLLYRQAEALVVRGTLRDAPRLIRENWPVWCDGLTPIGCFNHKPKKLPAKSTLDRHRRKLHGAIAVCDDSGVVIIEKKHHTKAFLKKLEHIEQQEDTWYDCIDRRKWSTFKTVCEKAYLKD